MPQSRHAKKHGSTDDDEDKKVIASRYRVEKKLGSGNFGVAFLVTDLKEKDQLYFSYRI
jgi:hypothetical protein